MEKGGDPAVPDVDKKIIKENILIKPVRPYIYGIYSSLTENAKIIGEFELMPPCRLDHHKSYASKILTLWWR